MKPCHLGRRKSPAHPFPSLEGPAGTRGCSHYLLPFSPTPAGGQVPAPSVTWGHRLHTHLWRQGQAWEMEPELRDPPSVIWGPVFTLSSTTTSSDHLQA